MKTRISEHSRSIYEQSSVSDLYTRYKKAFDKLLALDDIVRPFGPGEDVYQPDEIFENTISEVFTDSEDTVSIVIGYAGVGKSTSLRYIFKYHSPGAILYPPNEKTLIWAAHYNGHVDSNVFSANNKKINAIRDDLRQRIESICDYLEEKFPQLWIRFASDEGQDEFYRYINKTNRQILQHLSYNDSMTLPPWERKKKKLELAFEKERFTYIATKLKYYMGCKQCPCEKIIIILDDIEPLSYETQKELVLQYNKFLSCMLNRDESISEKPFIINLIISMRPYTFRELSQDATLSVFSKHRIVFKSNNINFGLLLDKKIKYYYNEIPHDNKKTFDEACDVLRILTKKFDFQYSEMIKDLALWNIRDSIEIFRNILKNRVWIQRNMDRSAAFSIDEESYVFNNITVLRAISCGSEFVYKESIDNVIPNLLQNTRGNKSYWFPILATFMFFKPYDVHGYAYTNEPICIRDIHKTFSEIFFMVDGIKDSISFAIDFLYRNSILIKGINDIYNEKKISLKEDTLLHLSPKGYRIAKIIKNDSVYFELCRETVYRDYTTNKRCPLSSYELMRQKNQYKIFVDLLTLLLELLEEEETYIRYSQSGGKTNQYNNTFGGLVSIIFLQGIDNSIKYSGYSGNDDIIQVHTLVEKKINYLDDMLYQNL